MAAEAIPKIAIAIITSRRVKPLLDECEESRLLMFL
jgi:hypothetical protein